MFFRSKARKEPVTESSSMGNSKSLDTIMRRAARMSISSSTGTGMTKSRSTGKIISTDMSTSMSISTIASLNKSVSMNMNGDVIENTNEVTFGNEEEKQERNNGEENTMRSYMGPILCCLCF